MKLHLEKKVIVLFDENESNKVQTKQSVSPLLYLFVSTLNSHVEESGSLHHISNRLFSNKKVHNRDPKYFQSQRDTI
jgi:hypothetical protein